MNDQHAWPMPGSRVTLRHRSGTIDKLVVREHIIKDGQLFAHAVQPDKPERGYTRLIDMFRRGW
jgi:hypothetical protein